LLRDTTGIARLRLHNQRLIGAPFKRPEDAVRSLCAVQAQDYPAAKWALGLRVKGCVDADIDRAYSDGTVLRTHVLRPTWHFVMPDDIRWMLGLTTPRIKRTMSYYDRNLELDAKLYRRSNAVIAKALAQGEHLTRSELSRALGDAGIDATGQRLNHIVMRAELDMTVCSGAMRGKQHTYALLDERAPRSRSLARDEALAELARRYFGGHGPALVQDFAWWAGLTVADAKQAIESVGAQLESETIDGRTYRFAPHGRVASVPDPTIHLLPNYDEYLIAYRDHSASLDARLPSGSGAVYEMLSRHIVVLNGRVIGGWKNVAEKQRVRVEAQLIVALDPAQRRALAAAAERYAAFIGTSVTVRASRALRSS
jgi:hypothetical protein